MSRIQLDQHSPYADVLVPCSCRSTSRTRSRTSRWSSTTTGRSCCARGTACSRGTRRRRRTSRPSGRTILASAFADDLPDGYGPSAGRAGSRWSVGSGRAGLAVVGRQVDPGRGRGARRGADPRHGRGTPELDRPAGARGDPLALGSAAPGRPRAPRARRPVTAGPRPRLVDPDPVPVGGRSSIVDATAWDASSGSFARHRGAVDAHGRRPGRPRRVDLGDLTGSSGHPASVHCPDQLGPWSGERRSRGRSRGRDGGGRGDRLTLTP